MKAHIKKYINRAIVCSAILISLVAQAQVIAIMVDNRTDKDVSVTFSDSRDGKTTKSVLGNQANGITIFVHGGVYVPYDAVIESVKIGEIECTAERGMRLPYKIKVTDSKKPSIKLKVTNKTSSVLPYNLEDGSNEIKACAVSLSILSDI